MFSKEPKVCPSFKKIPGEVFVKNESLLLVDEEGVLCFKNTKIMMANIVNFQSR